VATQITFSTENLTAPRQIGWIFFPEGEAKVAAKVMRDRLGAPPYVSLPTSYYRGKTVQIVYYEDTDTWREKREKLLRQFREAVGEEYFLNFNPTERGVHA
jgi:hypothetical protein